MCVCMEDPLCPLMVSCKLLLQNDVFMSVAMVSDKEKAVVKERKQEAEPDGKEIKV